MSQHLKGVLAVLAVVLCASAAAVEVAATPDAVELTAGDQKLAFTRAGDVFHLTISVRVDEEWKPLFDAGRPVLSGPSFDLQPSTCEVVDPGPERAVIACRGVHTNPDYPWTLRVEASDNVPWIAFKVTCHLAAPLTLNGLEPTVALWTRRPAVAVHLDQGPDSIYRDGGGGTPHNSGFPAAGFWDDGLEAMIFFDMGPMRWMSPEGIWRFHDVRIQARPVDDSVGLGMHLKKVSGTAIPEGDMIVPFYVCARPRPEKPRKLDLLADMIQTFAPLHPSLASWPDDTVPSEHLNWAYFARRAIENLMIDGVTMATIEAPWKDGPVEVAEPQQTMIVHPARAAATPEEARTAWDFSTVNNHLTPWLLYARLNANEAMYRAALAKANALPRFYDDRAGLIRHGTRVPEHVGDMEMTWQNLFFHIECLRAAEALPRADFNPAIAGRVLLAFRGLREYAWNVDYLFPQWFDPYHKAPIVQHDVPALGTVHEPWQAGSYAHLMYRLVNAAHRGCLVDEAYAALDMLMGGMAYEESNDTYSVSYHDPADFPITELFGNAYGSVAGLKDRYGRDSDQYGREMLNTLLRLTPWYEDDSDPVARSVRSAGLFYPHSGAASLCPWETVEANLCLAQHLLKDPEGPAREIILRLLNLNRINSFHFFPAAYNGRLRERDHRNSEQVDDYFPVESFYTLEGQGGHQGPTAAYMAGLAMWNYWMYEALAVARPRDVMVVNLDTLGDYPGVLDGVERHFVVYNPTSAPVLAAVWFRHLHAKRYSLEIQRYGEKLQQFRPQGAEELSQGALLALQPEEAIRVNVLWKPGLRGRGDERWRVSGTGSGLSDEYAAIQEHRAHVDAEDAARFAEWHRTRLAAYRAGKPSDEWFIDPNDTQIRCRTEGRQIAWIGLFTHELAGWLETAGEAAQGDARSRQRVDDWEHERVLDLPVFEGPSEQSAKLGVIRTHFKPLEPAWTCFLPANGTEEIPFVPDIYEPGWAYSPYCHQTILERRGDWFLLPEVPLPKPGWISAASYPERAPITLLEPGGIYTFSEESIVILDILDDGVLVRPEQDCDMWCSSNPPPMQPFEPRKLTRKDLSDANGHLLLKKKYTRGC